MRKKNSRDLTQLAHEIEKLCHAFLNPRRFAYFQFKRIYKDCSFIILANHPEFFYDFLEQDLNDPCPTSITHLRQSTLFFWDECLKLDRRNFMNKEKEIYHGLTIISRRRNFFDCTTFAMDDHHSHPFAYYFHCLKELQNFSELFPKKARNFIEAAKTTQKHCQKTKNHTNYRKAFFLPKRSSRFQIGEGGKDYITTYEALCVQLLQEGKSYKEIGSILSMAPSTVETHLKRLKARTGLTMQELSLHCFPITHEHVKRLLPIEQALELKTRTSQKAKQPKNTTKQSESGD